MDDGWHGRVHTAHGAMVTWRLASGSRAGATSRRPWCACLTCPRSSSEAASASLSGRCQCQNAEVRPCLTASETIFEKAGAILLIYYLCCRGVILQDDSHKADRVGAVVRGGNLRPPCAVEVAPAPYLHHSTMCTPSNGVQALICQVDRPWDSVDSR